MGTDRPAYCPTCGSELTTSENHSHGGGYCPTCEVTHEQKPKPCAGTLVVDDNAVLLVQRTQPPAVGSWSVPAGYLEYDEEPVDAAVRELEEETGLEADANAIETFDTVFVAPDHGSSVVVIIYVVTRESTQGTPAAGSDAGDVAFWEYTSLTSDAPLEPGYRGTFQRAIEQYGRAE